MEDHSLKTRWRHKRHYRCYRLCSKECSKNGDSGEWHIWKRTGIRLKDWLEDYKWIRGTEWAKMPCIGEVAEKESLSTRGDYLCTGVHDTGAVLSVDSGGKLDQRPQRNRASSSLFLCFYCVWPKRDERWGPVKHQLKNKRRIRIDYNITI